MCGIKSCHGFIHWKLGVIVMTGKPQQQHPRTGISRYQITVKGKLAENWADLFHEARIDIVNSIEDGPLTVMACQVRDQAELTGILNWFHNMNLILLEVKAVREEKNDV
jgi:hypothetical protein